MIEMKDVSGGYHQKNILKDINLSIEEGSFFTLLGPNGSGKTTLFKLITGILPLSKGTIEVEGKSLNAYTAQEQAQVMAVLSQESHVEFDFTVKEIIMLGRYPHQKGLIKHTSQEDLRIVADVMEQTDVTRYQNKPFRTLSGGEKQRVLLAKALAQQPRVLFLDEPTNHLDIKHTVMMLEHLKKHQQESGLTIVAILHDLNTAALFADEVGLLHEGRLVEKGGLSLLQKESLLKSVYDVPVLHQYHPAIPKSQIVVTPKKRTETFFQYDFTHTDEWIHLHFSTQLRTMANSVVGGGLGWSMDFCNFYVDKHYNCADPEKDLIGWLQKKDIDPAHTIGMMTAVKLADKAVVKDEIQDIALMAVVTAGVGNAVDITEKREFQVIRPGTINVMVFMDTHLTDGGLVNAIQSATEAKTKALSHLKVNDPVTGTVATGTSTDSIVIATTQNGPETPYAGSGTAVGQAIGHIVYAGVTQAIQNYWKRTKS